MIRVPSSASVCTTSGRDMGTCLHSLLPCDWCECKGRGIKPKLGLRRVNVHWTPSSGNFGKASVTYDPHFTNPWLTSWMAQGATGSHCIHLNSQPPASIKGWLITFNLQLSPGEESWPALLLTSFPAFSSASDESVLINCSRKEQAHCVLQTPLPELKFSIRKRAHLSASPPFPALPPCLPGSCSPG